MFVGERTALTPLTMIGVSSVPIQLLSIQNLLPAEKHLPQPLLGKEGSCVGESLPLKRGG
jgi:hypothetical protein